VIFEFFILLIFGRNAESREATVGRRAEVQASKDKVVFRWKAWTLYRMGVSGH
jgi:hypothetical protein